MPTDSDIDQYKVTSVHEHPLDSRQLHLDLMCFPALFPTVTFGENYTRDVKISHCEYVKSRSLDEDSRFRKDAQYVFYLLWQKDLHELNIYNTLKTTRRQSTSLTTLLNQVDRSDEQLESNLCTMLQSVQSTKQYWFLRHSELKCMVKDFGPPSQFLTFSCAEYEST